MKLPFKCFLEMLHDDLCGLNIEQFLIQCETFVNLFYAQIIFLFYCEPESKNITFILMVNVEIKAVAFKYA